MNNASDTPVQNILLDLGEHVVEVQHVILLLSSGLSVQDAPGAVREPGPGPGPAPHPGPLQQLRGGDSSAPADRPHRLPLHLPRVPLR